uniref:Histone H2A n=1 Tax=Echinococcus granulosus TaxID=6210 RepID=A0A068WWL2_ECHGR|nr:hypothetical protein EgrG_002033600 [Echinococcus granulosus]
MEWVSYGVSFKRLESSRDGEPDLTEWQWMRLDLSISEGTIPNAVPIHDALECLQVVSALSSSLPLHPPLLTLPSFLFEYDYDDENELVKKETKRELSGFRAVTEGAPLYLNAVIERLAADVLKLAGNVARDNVKTRIIPRHLQLATGDEDLTSWDSFSRKAAVYKLTKALSNNVPDTGSCNAAVTALSESVAPSSATLVE